MKTLLYISPIGATLLTGSTIDIIAGTLYTLPWVFCGLSIVGIIYVSYLSYRDSKIQDELECKKIKEKFLNKGDGHE